MRDISEKKRVLFLNSEILLSDCLSTLIKSMSEFDIYTVESVQEASNNIANFGRYDVVIVNRDALLDDFEEALQKMNRENTGGVGIYTNNITRRDVERWLEVGIAGFIPKSTRLSIFLHALRLISDGEKYLPCFYLLNTSSDIFDTYGLKSREFKVLSYLVEGLGNREISDRVGVEVSTVKMEVRAICRKLKVGNRTQAALKAHRERLI